jgi:FKBP-type peptidyl-prolyl cis-trans isomerase SlyD
MQIEQGRVVAFHYRVGDADGTAVDSSHERGVPLWVLVGGGAIIPGLERALIGRSAGESFQVDVAPADGYGERRADWTQRVPKKYFRDAGRLRPGDVTVLDLSGGGRRQVTVLKVGSSVIDVDLNPPLAGRTLHFEVEIVEVREATAEERAHGHAHAPGSHAH